ncbi:GapS4a family protein [Chryseobacterium salviniae]|uniref:GAPS4 PD-(D/E)XK nuclease domain-containing protein n=1 Tax=Chryseobacterium salviniae TaxID=3101750 RepID=A0ABU6HTR2_9FLAO|nr:hypothetical protein [Chryseobacterium sp. T9W2-O]MEC3876422.1 hypothetical protein [Chryseobacterium sp. T9W2-O]
MGEWSKSVGEKGENVCKFIFENILNFNSLIENESISCIKGSKHRKKNSESNRKTHGIDGLVSYRNPLEDYSLDIGIISSKYTADSYPNSPTTVFKEHLADLAQTIECFSNSKIINNLNQNYTEVTKTETVGILVWLSNKSDLSFDLISKVNNIQIDSDLIFDRIILLDNNKVTFLYDSIFNVKKTFGSENVDFVYHNSGLNIVSQQNSFGKIFPLNYLYSDIIALRIISKEGILLSIFINDYFEESKFAQFLNFAKSFDHLNSVNKIILNFRNYDYLINEKSVKEKLTNFPMYILNKNLEINQFPSDFRNK